MKLFLERRLPDFVLLIYVLAATVGVFTGGLWAGLGIGTGVIAFFSVWAMDRRLPLPDKNLALMACAFFGAAAALNLQSSRPALAWHEWVRLITVFVPLGFLLAPNVAARVLHPKFFVTITVTAAIGCLALSVELYLKAPLLHHFRGPDAMVAGYNRGLSYVVLIAFPLLAALWSSKNRWTVALFILVLLIPASLMESRTAKLALILAAPVVISGWLAPVFTRRTLAITPFASLGWPFAAQWFFANHRDYLDKMPMSWHARIEIWDYMSYRIMERPWLGWGLGSSVKLDYTNPDGALYVFTTMPAAHPHNAIIQLWAELGLPGIALGIAFALLTLHKAGRLDPRLAPFALGAWVTALCFCLLAYNFWTDSLFAAFAMTGLAFMLLERKLKAPRFSAGGPTIH